MDKTAFEKLLQEYFPDIYRLHKLGESEAHLWELVTLILENNMQQVTGEIVVRYTQGHIEDINQTVKMLAFKKSRPGY